MKSKFVYTKGTLIEYACVMIIFAIIFFGGVWISEPILMFSGGLLLIATAIFAVVMSWIRGTQEKEIKDIINKNVQATGSEPESDPKEEDNAEETTETHAEVSGSEEPVLSEAAEDPDGRGKV